MIDGGAGIPIVEDVYSLVHRTGHGASLPEGVSGVKGKTHDSPLSALLLSLRTILYGIPQIYLVHQRIKEMSLGIIHALHEGCRCHIRIHFLYHQVGRTLRLILVRAHRIHLHLPLFLALHIHLVTLMDIGHDVADRSIHAALSGARRGHEHIHESGFVLYAIDIFKAHLIEVGCKRWKYGMSHGWLVDVRGTTH